MTTDVRPQRGYPSEWGERYAVELTGLTKPLPDDVKYYCTPGHGYLRVNINSYPNTGVSVYDYLNGSTALLEEDCSMGMWLAENGYRPLEDYIQDNINDIPRVFPARKEQDGNT